MARPFLLPLVGLLTDSSHCGCEIAQCFSVHWLFNTSSCTAILFSFLHLKGLSYLHSAALFWFWHSLLDKNLLKVTFNHLFNGGSQDWSLKSRTFDQAHGSVPLLPKHDQRQADSDHFSSLWRIFFTRDNLKPIQCVLKVQGIHITSVSSFFQVLP